MNRLDTIIDALESACKLLNNQILSGLDLEEALAAARELRELKPVGFFKQKGAAWHQYDEEHPAYTALYRLD